MTPGERLRKIASGLTPPRSERRAVLYLIPALMVISLVLVHLNTPKFEKSFPQYADQVLQNREAQQSNAPAAEPETAPELFAFDPNTVSFHDLCRLGIPKNAAAGIVKYRAKGKRFEIPEDFATCYGVTEAMYRRLEPWIVIGERWRAKPSVRTTEPVPSAQSPKTHTLTTFDPNTADAARFAELGFSQRQAEVILRYREMTGGFRTADDFGKCYVVRERIEELRPYIVIAPTPAPAPKTKEKVELNSADTTALMSVTGIGRLTAGRIVAYRARLGGFDNVEQLREIQGMTDRNYETILQEIYVDRSGIKKIDINFATLSDLKGHPYLDDVLIRKILSDRQKKGGWHQLGEMIETKTLTPKQAKKLAPYLVFQ